MTTPPTPPASTDDTPAPGAHDLLVRVEAVSINPVDAKLRAAAPDDPRILGFDAVGTVLARGAESSLFAIGDRVFYAGDATRPGSFQPRQLVDERIVGPCPRGIPAVEAAGLPLVNITAWECLFDRLALDASSCGSLLIVGATGGVGLAAVQLAAALLPDLRIIATGSAERAELLRDLGAHEVVDHRGDLRAQIGALAPEGIDAVLTAYSAGQIETYAEILRPFGQIVAIDDGERDIAPLKPKSISWHWERMFTRSMFTTPDMIEQHRILRRVSELVDAGRIRPVIAETLTPISPENLHAGMDRVATGRTLGKVVLEGWAD